MAITPCGSAGFVTIKGKDYSVLEISHSEPRMRDITSARSSHLQYRQEIDLRVTYFDHEAGQPENIRLVAYFNRG